MAVKIRLKRMGKIRAPHYRIVVADSRTKRDGKTIEQIGKYHPKSDPSFIEVNSERVQHWLSVGAQPTEPVVAILKRTGDWQKFKGEPAPAEPLRVLAPKAEKRALYDEALRDAHSGPQSEAVSQKKSRKPKAEEKPAADEKGAEQAESKDAAETADAAQGEG
ncbi:30S ribosomal protein S16 [Actinopolymorpha alba]|uniref:30S ribosomal protein S16 n=1 Tax=Actinopolymorpha alba TaxID=533267 RepID=UPI00038269F5|nr:30S ribosomal protein S16 [Actinopolymorpha alba]